jgi:hypothetical protein
MPNQNNHYEIFIDKNGIWYFRGAEMERRDIVQYFYQHFRRDNEGNYLIEINGDRCYVGVEDVPYIIRSVSVGSLKDNGQPNIMLSLSDGSSERLNLNLPFRIG